MCRNSKQQHMKGWCTTVSRYASQTWVLLQEIYLVSWLPDIPIKVSKHISFLSFFFSLLQILFQFTMSYHTEIKKLLICIQVFTFTTYCFTFTTASLAFENCGKVLKWKHWQLAHHPRSQELSPPSQAWSWISFQL